MNTAGFSQHTWVQSASFMIETTSSALAHAAAYCHITSVSIWGAQTPPALRVCGVCLCRTWCVLHSELCACPNHNPLCVQEHLILVCELLRANLYEFQKYQRENGDDPYFTPPRIQRIAIQVHTQR